MSSGRRRPGSSSGRPADTRQEALADRLGQLDSRLGAFVHLDPSPLALPAGELSGRTVAVKDNIDVRGMPSRAGSLTEPPEPRTDDSTVVARIRAAGGLLLGKTTTMELAIGAPDLDGTFPVPLNPWDLTRWAGGSTSGLAVAVAAGMANLAIGTDTGGSIRMPAAFCGVTGLKPTFGLVPNTGSRPLARSADTIGPLAASARECALMIDVVAGEDGRDESVRETFGAPVVDALEEDVAGAVVGVWRPDSDERADGLFRVFEAALETLRGLGCRLVDVEPPSAGDLLVAHRTTLHYEAYAEHQERWSRGEPLSPGFVESVGPGADYAASQYLTAQSVRRRVSGMTRTMFDEVDVVVSPTASVTAIPIGRVSPGFVRHMRNVHTGFWSATGCPALSVPMGLADDRLPLGLQIAAWRFGEAAVLRLGHAFQGVTGHHRARPAIFQH